MKLRPYVEHGYHYVDFHETPNCTVELCENNLGRISLKSVRKSVSCTMGTGSFPGVKSGRGVLLITHPLLVPRSWKNRPIPLTTLQAKNGPVTGTLYLYIYLICTEVYDVRRVVELAKKKTQPSSCTGLLYIEYESTTLVRNVETMQPPTQRYISIQLNPQHTLRMIKQVNTHRTELKPRDFSSDSRRDGRDVLFF